MTERRPWNAASPSQVLVADHLGGMDARGMGGQRRDRAIECADTCRMHTKVAGHIGADGMLYARTLKGRLGE